MRWSVDKLPRFVAQVAGIALLGVLAGRGATPVRAARADKQPTLRVFAAASLADAFTQLGRALERQRPGLRVVFNFAGSQQLATQLEQGAVADVFASADERWLNHVRDFGLIAGASPTFARNRLVVIVPLANPARITGLQDLARPGVKLVMGGDAVPVGRYGRTVLANLARDPAFGKDFAPRTLRNVVSEEENVGAVVGKVQLGEADAGVVYRSDVTPAVARYVRIVEIPDSANVIACYPIAVLMGAPRPEDARAFVALVTSGVGRGILLRCGLIPAGTGL